MNFPAPACPTCSKPLMSRMAKLCSWCSAPIPDVLRFTPVEIQRIHTEEAAAKKTLKDTEKDRALEKGNKSREQATAAIITTQVIRLIQ